jgi:putative transcriptional regulator
MGEIHFGKEREERIKENLRRMQTGSVLFSLESLRDPEFDMTLVLLCAYSNEGAYGLVLNRLSHMPVSEIFNGFGGISKHKDIYIGGPVQQEELQIVQVTKTPADGAFEIAENVFIGGKWDGLNEIIQENSVTTRMFLGYSGWGAGQLEMEIKAGAWDVYNVDIVKLLSEPIYKIGNNSEMIVSYLNSIIKD